jgi:nondiscriminating glutamyl-tRNA synthetase
MTSQLRVRFAPSPSGDLHVGGARTALFNWLYARKEGGRYIFRIEDSDADRSDEGSIQSILESLRWLGLAPDEGEGLGGPHPPYRQSLALALYQAAAKPLIESKRAYWCYDTAEEAEAERQQLLHHPEARKKRHPHRGLDEAGQAALRADGRVPSLRFATDDLQGVVAWDDGVRGRVEVDLSEIRDFNLLKSDATPMYNFACVVDDHRMGITQVMRGEDGISNTPRQLLLFQAFGWPAPSYSHVSFILGPDGQKLSKRHGDTGIARFKEKGYLPEALLNYLGLLGLGGDGEGSEVFSLEELKARFSPDKLVKKASIFDYGKLDFLNAHWLRTKTGAELKALAAPFLEGLEAVSEAWLVAALETFKGNAERLTDLRAPLEALLVPLAHGAECLAQARVFAQPGAPAKAFLEVLGAGAWPADEAGFKAWLKQAQGLAGVKGKDFFMPLRLALTASEHGPELPKLLALLGPEKAKERLEGFLKALS